MLVEDDEDDYIIIRAFIPEIKTPSFVLDWVTTYESGLDAMRNNRFAAYLVDYRLGPWSGLDLLREAIASGCVGPIIILTGQGDHEVDMTAMEAGAADYLIKDQIDAPLLERSIVMPYAISKLKRTCRLARKRCVPSIKASPSQPLPGSTMIILSFLST
ncbi:MAG: response regulator [Anaerolineales bacterium]|nr:response regulator [Anaerolineales bacterium]